MCKVQKKRCNYEKSARMRKERDLMPRMQNRKEKRMVELESGGAVHKGKSTIRQYMDRGSERYSKRKG